MSARRLLAATLLVALPVTTLACGDSKSTSTSPTTTVKGAAKKSTPKSTTTTDSSSSGDSTTSVAGSGDSTPKTAFAEGINAAQDQLTAGSGDICKLGEISNTLSSVKDPATADEAKAAAEFIDKYFNAIADLAPTGQEAGAAALRGAGTKLLDQLKAANYDPKVLTAGSTAIDDPAVTAALGTFFTATQEQCGGTTTTVG